MPSDLPQLHTELLVAGATTGGACSVFSVAGAAGATIPPHRRARHDACVVLVAGAATVRTDEVERRLAPGDAGWLPRDAACRVELLEESRLLLLTLPAGFEELVGAGGAQPDEDDVAVLLGLSGVSLLPPGWGAARAAAH